MTGSRDGIALEKSSEIVPSVTGPLERYASLFEVLGEERGIVETGSAF